MRRTAAGHLTHPPADAQRSLVPDLPDVVVEPGTRLVGRYRLDAHLGGRGEAGASTITTTGGSQMEGATYWRAHDELLDRPVGVWLLRGGTSYAERVLGAARRAAALTDARFLRILDAAEGAGDSGEQVVYVVSEWVPAVSLTELVADGPLPAAEAHALATEITAALVAAHEAGLTHLALRPEHVLRAAHGQVKLSGLEIEAAARGLGAGADAEREDTRGAAAVLYAGLTGRWPGDEATGLPPAPKAGRGFCSPRQVRAGVPDDLDDVVCRALDLPGRHAGPPLHTLDALQQALAEYRGPATVRLPLPGLVGRAHDAAPPVLPSPTAGPELRGPLATPAAADDAADEPRRSRMAAAAWVLVSLVLLAGVALAAAQLVEGFGARGAPEESAPTEQPGPSDAAPARPLEIVAATGFDPQGDSYPPPRGAENDDRAELAVDGEPGTSWNTLTYYDPLGATGLKDGVGLLLELAGPAEIERVTVHTRGGPTDLQVRVAERRGDALEDYRLVGEAGNVDGAGVLTPDRPVTGRYVLVWLTGLPTVGEGWRGEIAEVSVRGRT